MACWFKNGLMFLMLRQSGTTVRLRLHDQNVNQDPKNSNSLAGTKRKGVNFDACCIEWVGWLENAGAQF